MISSHPHYIDRKGKKRPIRIGMILQAEVNTDYQGLNHNVASGRIQIEVIRRNNIILCEWIDNTKDIPALCITNPGQSKIQVGCTHDLFEIE